MKNIGLCWMFLTGFAIPVQSQITITNQVFPAAGDTLFYAVDNQPGSIVITPPGGNQHWDFSNLHPSFTWERIYQDASAGANYGSFPSATLFYQTGIANAEAYLRVTGQEVSLLGFSGGDPAALGLNLVSVYNPPVVESRAPVQFFDIHQISSGLLIPFEPGILPGVAQLPVNPDSLRIRVAISRLDVVDAWGTLSIPGGAYEVLRQKRTEYRESRLDAKVPPLGWLDITDVAIQALNLSSLGVDTTITYHFLNGQSKEAIAVCTADNSGLAVVSVQYKNLDVSTGVKDAGQAGIDLAVFPNPAVDILHIRVSSPWPENHTLLICNILGEEVWRKTCSGPAGQLEEEVDIAHFEKGVYLCRSLNGGRRTGQVLFVKSR